MYLQNILEYILFVTVSRICCLIGLKNSRAFGKMLGNLFYYMIPIRLKVVLKNLRIAFPDLPDTDIKKLARKNYQALGKTFMEILFLPAMNPERMKQELKIVNLDFVQGKYDEGKGLILMTAHFGNWEYAAISMGLQLSQPLSVIVKNQRNPFVNKWLTLVRSRWGNKCVPLGASVKSIYKELIEKRVVALAADQRGPAEGLRVQLLGRSSAVYSGPAALAYKTGAPLLIGMVVRNADDSYTFNLEEISLANLPADSEKAIQELSQRHTDILESYIKRYPDQWFWMHNRWKY